MNKIELKSKILEELKLIAKELNLAKEPFLIEPKTNADFSTSMAIINKTPELNPIALANLIKEKLLTKSNELYLEEVEVAGPGFINLFLNKNYIVQAINDILKKGKNYGKGNKKGSINIEWVSANPTGYLHVGHARNAAIGSTVANICEFAGLKITREYYINDAGNQIDLLANSLFSRYQQLFNKDYPMPEECYRGEDIQWAADQMFKRYADKFKGIKLEGQVLEVFKKDGVELFLGEIKKDLEKFGGIKFDIWFSEKSLYENDQKIIKDALAKIKNTYQKDGATWLNTTLHGDDKDRVLVKSDGSLTYFTPDIAYHNIKYHRNNDKDTVVMNVWGADHSGYIKRMKCAMEDIGNNPDNLVVLCMQLVRLVKNGEEYKMSKRRGTSFFLREFVDLVGVDSARFILLDRTYNSKLDFDIDIAKNKTNDNPAILVQYANARAYSLLQKTTYDLNKLEMKTFNSDVDQKLISTLLEFPEIIDKSADLYMTNILTQYLIKLAKDFNSWYSNSDKVIGHENEESLLALVKSTNTVLETGMKLIGITINHKM
ncbi:arginine--tRNA ligase [Mycoplasmopsis alligatoris]|uniref:Arginine--tRNA ligase n=1 Tax=Mycoplasmopsis alligatoris A21JP2 TaxID=747682 RepID=D4XVP3_9BACT|nr:arginine--tRNA ligase [Mycoplasmopsis alligatoris]EFF41639.1 arginine--tRNA ligase [Mycoplasmopsis alligatoris A21JP2]